LLSLVWALGEQLNTKNLAYQTKVVDPQDIEMTALTDGNRGTGVSIEGATIALANDSLVSSVEVYENEPPSTVFTSVDNVFWKSLTENRKIEGGYSYAVPLEVVRYVRVVNPTAHVCYEVVVRPREDYVFHFSMIDVQAKKDRAELAIALTAPAMIQINYGTNYDFIYEKKLTQAETLASYQQQQKIMLKNLQPETTYRYQVIAADVLGKKIYSNYFTFTTTRE
jgi:hypothetical protein